jgi:hypothetical protein
VVGVPERAEAGWGRGVKKRKKKKGRGFEVFLIFFSQKRGKKKNFLTLFPFPSTSGISPSPSISSSLEKRFASL